MNNNRIVEFTRGTDLSDHHVPNVQLCRFFSEKKYADSFVNGQFRFVNLSQYKKSEYVFRSDPTELEFSTISTNGTFNGGNSSSSCFAICFTELDSETEIDRLKQKFGTEDSDATLVKITNNLELTKRIQKAWRNSTIGNGITSCKWYEVVYNKFEMNNINTFEDDFHVYQKPKKHVLHKMKRVLKSPVPQSSARSLSTVDVGGEVGTVKELSSLDSIDYMEYKQLITNEDWEEITPIENNFAIEREWRLVFFSDHRQEKNSGEYLLPMSNDAFFLNL